LVISHTALLGAGALAGVLSSPEGREFTLDMLQDRDLPVPGVPGLNFRFNVTGPNQQLFLNLDLAQLISALRRQSSDDGTANQCDAAQQCIPQNRLTSPTRLCLWQSYAWGG